MSIIAANQGYVRAFQCLGDVFPFKLALWRAEACLLGLYWV